jgi:2-desacetyl-2-hydroxyethyl bacteriochlorophyllide A dehydrogenase
MRALVMQLMADGRREKILVDDWADQAAPTGNQFKAQTLFSGVTNGTERNNLLGGNYSQGDDALPYPYGYQNVARVVEVGPECKAISLGDVVYTSTDHLEFILDADDSLLVKLPDNVDPKDAALFGVASVAMHDVRRAETKLGDRVLVVGAGPIGQFTAQSARAAGAHVTICDLDAKRLELAAKCGAHRTVRITGEETWSGELIAEGKFDIVFEDSGADVIKHIIGKGWGEGVINFRGKVVVIAGRDDVLYNFNAGQGLEVCLIQASHFDNSDLAEVARLVGDGVMMIEPLIQDVVKPADAKGIYDALRDAPNTLMGTVFDWQ